MKQSSFDGRVDTINQLKTGTTTIGIYCTENYPLYELSPLFYGLPVAILMNSTA